MAIPCQAQRWEGVTTIGSSPSTAPIGTALEVPASYLEYTKGLKEGWVLELVEDIV